MEWEEAELMPDNTKKENERMNKITELQIITSKIDQDIGFIIFKTKLIQSLATTTRSNLSTKKS